MATKPHRYFWVILLAFLIVALASCTPVTDSTETPIPTAVSPTLLPTATLIPVTVTSSPLPTQPIIPVITPDSIQVENWKEYENKLAKSLLSFLPPEVVLCEWEILGRSGQDVYVWAVCEGGGSGASVPVVIHLEADGAVQTVEEPKNWSPDIQRMFPIDVREKFEHYNFGRAREMSEHIDLRREHPEEPPLIVLSATAMP